MSWMQELTQDTFKIAVREAMRPDIENIRGDIKDLQEQVTRLEKALHNTTRVCEASLKIMFVDFKNELFQKLIEK